MLRCIDVHKSYRDGANTVHALRGVDLHIPEPGFHAIMGQSGSGKTTLLHLLASLDRPDRGEIHIGEHAIHALHDRDATAFRRTGVGIVFQRFNLVPTLTALENAELPGVLAGADPGSTRDRAAELLALLDVGDRAHHRPDAMSGGEQQRVAIARALLFSPPVLLADEPTGNLDSRNAERLWALLERVAQEQQTTVIMVTHEPAAAAHCQRVHILRDGRVVGELDSEHLDASGVAAGYQHHLG